MHKKSTGFFRKLLNRTPSNRLALELQAKMHEPMFVHPDLGSATINYYLDTMRHNGNRDMDDSHTKTQISDGIAVMTISGALLSRPVEMPCGGSPDNYESIKSEFGELFEDQSIHTIVARFDSQGGVASQNMDLSDYIFGSRGLGTKLIAVVDDMAYSAAFGIASAFEEVWVSRTSGVGSVGVVSYHEDRSEQNRRAGVSVEYIYAGDQKIFGNPNEPLSDKARKSMQSEVSRLYSIFTSTVARNLNMSVIDVMGTQAATFHGEDAIEAGFAHKLGTFEDAINSIVRGEEFKSDEVAKPIAARLDNSNDIEVTMSEQEIEQDVNPEKVAEQAAVDVGEVTPEDAVVEDVKQSAVALVAEKVDNEKELQNAAAIRALCMVFVSQSSSNDVDSEAMAENFIISGMSVEEVSKHFLALTSTSETSMVSSSNAGAVDSGIQKGWASAVKLAQKN